MDINTLDPPSLPSLAFTERSKLPVLSCVYFVISSGEVIYIGQTVNLHQRFCGHHRYSWFCDLSDCAVYWLTVDPVDLVELERSAILHHRPRLNGPDRTKPTQELVSTTFRMPEALLEAAREKSRETGISLSFIARKAIEEFANK